MQYDNKQRLDLGILRRREENWLIMRKRSTLLVIREIVKEEDTVSH